MNTLDALAALGITVATPADALPLLRRLYPERGDLIDACTTTTEDPMTTDTTTPDNAPAASHEFLWLDLETTGLDPMNGLVLEFAAVLCEDARGDDFAVTEQYAGAIHYPDHVIEQVKPDDVVKIMHNKNGLWADVKASTTRVVEVDTFLQQLAESLTNRKRSIVLAGSSVHFDLAWCRVHFPKFSQYLSHRVFDVTTLRRAVDAWLPVKPGTPSVEWPFRDAHRALPDVLASIAECRVARRAFFGAP